MPKGDPTPGWPQNGCTGNHHQAITTEEREQHHLMAHAYPQLRLYREGLDLLHPEQVLYMDTVSLIYKWSPGLPELPTGPFLGKLKKELDDKDTIVEFATAGPKTYGFRTHLRTLKCKVHGFRLNIPASNN